MLALILLLLFIASYVGLGATTVTLLDKYSVEDLRGAEPLVLLGWPIIAFWALFYLPIKGIELFFNRNDPIKQLEKEIKRAELELVLEEKREKVRRLQEAAFDKLLS